MTQERGVSFKEAAAQIMEEAYFKVSGNDTLPANARQIMYAARPHIQKVTGRELRNDYFTQTLLPDYLDEKRRRLERRLRRAWSFHRTARRRELRRRHA
jgi:hypothetical protein